MTRPLRAAVAAAALASVLLPAAPALAFPCPDGWVYRSSGVIDPTTGRAIHYCWPPRS